MHGLGIPYGAMNFVDQDYPTLRAGQDRFQEA